MAEDLHPEHQDLLQFLYQIPIGVIAMDEIGAVSTINPAASRLLSPELEPGETVSEPLPILARLTPGLIEKLEADPEHLGMISTGRGRVVDGRDGTTRFSVSIHRLRLDHIIVSLTDVTEERRIVNEQRSRAERLQRALLGSIDATNLSLSVAYHPANRSDLSGGDWYDVINLGADRYALVVGDVVGHDIEASATMGQLRTIVRAFALVDAEPSGVLERTETIASTIDEAACATINYALLDRASSTVTYACAGHPPPLILRADGSTDLLVGGRRPALSIGSPRQTSASTEFDDDDVLIMYTDGLIERRGESLDQGLERLRTTAASHRSAPSIDELVDRITRAMLNESNHRDDVCVLAVQNRLE